MANVYFTSKTSYDSFFLTSVAKKSVHNLYKFINQKEEFAQTEEQSFFILRFTLLTSGEDHKLSIRRRGFTYISVDHGDLNCLLQFRILRDP